MTAISTAINTAPTLTDLCAILNRLQKACTATFACKLEEVVDLSALPTFGGEEPRNTAGIFSWDADRLLLADGKHWYTVAR